MELVTTATLSDIRRLVSTGELTAVQVVRERQRCIIDSDLNAVVTPNPAALDQARLNDSRIRAGGRPGPLHGVPFTVKDSVDVAGLPSTAGSRVLADHIPTRTATAVQRLIDAGAIFLGKTNCSEFAVDTHTDNPVFGPTLNPLDRSRTSGGSSGGDSAAVAGGLSAFGVGTDFGGSIRWPAHCTGLAALRATPGALPRDGILPFSAVPTKPRSDLLLARLMTIAPIAHTVADLSLLYAVMRGGPVPDVPEREPFEGTTVAWFGSEGTVPVQRVIMDAVESAAMVLADHGGRITSERPPGLDECADLFVRIRDGQGLPEVEQLVGADLSPLGAGLRDYLRATASSRLRCDVSPELRHLEAIRHSVLAFLEEVPVLLLPVASVTAPRPSPFVDVDGAPVAWSQLGSCARAISVLGLPVVVVPHGRDADGLPIGIQVVGRPGHERQTLAAAALIEAATTNPSTLDPGGQYREHQ
jgi:Asp-tRNA(Asn)/Glu-tRNA(Gln) amidotransferase A subunit family amidase